MRIKTKRAEAYLDVIVGVFLSIIMIVVVINMVSYYSAYHRVEYIAEEMARCASMHGSVADAALEERYIDLVAETGLSITDDRGFAGTHNMTISFDGDEDGNFPGSEADENGIVQRGKMIRVIISVKADLQLIGSSAGYKTATITLVKSVLSENYVKETD